MCAPGDGRRRRVDVAPRKPAHAAASRSRGALPGHLRRGEFARANDELDQHPQGRLAWAAALVAAHRQSGDLVLFNAYFTQMPFDYYFLAEVHADRSLREPVTERGYQTEESLLFANLAPPSPGIQSGPELNASREF